jgi:hypothetical protein
LAGGSDIVWNLGDPQTKASAPGATTVTLAAGWAHLNMIENLNLLVVGGYVQYKIFICPASGNSEAARMPGGTGLTNNQALSYGFYDVSGAAHCDYAYQVGYTWSKIRGAAAPAYACGTDMSREPDSGLVILADAPPSTCGTEADLCGIIADTFNGNVQSTAWNQGNHKRDGVNTLAGYSVAWSNGKTSVGWNNNEIYQTDINATSSPVQNQLYTTLAGGGVSGATQQLTPGSTTVPNCLDDSCLMAPRLPF